jgi:hypothetical protein
VITPKAVQKRAANRHAMRRGVMTVVCPTARGKAMECSETRCGCGEMEQT